MTEERPDRAAVESSLAGGNAPPVVAAARGCASSPAEARALRNLRSERYVKNVINYLSRRLRSRALLRRTRKGRQGWPPDTGPGQPARRARADRSVDPLRSHD